VHELGPEERVEQLPLVTAALGDETEGAFENYCLEYDSDGDENDEDEEGKPSNMGSTDSADDVSSSDSEQEVPAYRPSAAAAKRGAAKGEAIKQAAQKKDKK